MDFTTFWVLHFAHVTEPLYKLMKKGKKFIWNQEQDEAIEKLKEFLKSPSILRHVDYQCGRLVIITVDASSIAIG